MFTSSILCWDLNSNLSQLLVRYNHSTRTPAQKSVLFGVNLTDRFHTIEEELEDQSPKNCH